MKQWLADIWRFASGRTSHPVYRRELAGWSYIGLWRSLRRGCAPISALAIAALTLVCSGMCWLIVAPDALETDIQWLIPIAILVGLFISERVFRFANGLVATVLGATAISAELEADTFALLRLTLIPPREIVAAKFGAVITQIRTPTVILILVRILIIAVVIIALVSLVMNAFPQISPTPQPVPSPIAPSLPPAPPVSPLRTGLIVLLYVIAILMLILAVLLWLFYYVMLPVLEVFLFASLGLFASSLARTRGSGLLTAGGMRLVFWVGSYMAGQFFSVSLSFLGLPLTLLPNIPQWLEPVLSEPAVSLILIALGALVMLAIVVGIQVGLVIGLLSWTSRRASRLPFGSL